MKTIRALKNFGFQEKHIEPGTVLEVNPDDFGGTYQDFIDAGLFEEITGPGAATPGQSPDVSVPETPSSDAAPASPPAKPRKPVSATVTIEESDGSTVTEPLPVASIPTI